MPLVREEDGTFAVTRPGEAGARYRYRVDAARTLPDPMSRAQPEGVLGPSAVVDPASFAWTDDDWSGLALDDAGT